MGTVKNRTNPAVLPDADRRDPVPWAMEVERCLFISRKKSKDDFVLVRMLSSSSYSILHYVAIEGRVMQMELRYIYNAYEATLLKRTRKLCSEGLFVELEAVSEKEYRQFERVAMRHLKGIMKRKQLR